MISLLNGPVYIPPHVQDAFAQPICDLRHPRFQKAYAYCRTQVAELLGASGYPTVLAAGSGTFGVELVLRSCLAPDDRVLALVMGTFSERMAEIAELTGAGVLREEAEVGDIVSLERLECLLNSERPTVLLAAHVEPSTGTQMDLESVATLCRQYGTVPIVDGVCAGFALEVNVRRDQLGAYITASQKGLSLPPGMTIAVVSPLLIARAELTRPSKTGLYGHLLRWTSDQISFTPPMQHIFALEQSLKYIHAETMTLRAARHHRYSSLVKNWANESGFHLVPRTECAAWTLTALYYQAGQDDTWLREVRDQHGVELAPSNDKRLSGKYFRIGHLGDLPETQIRDALSILSRVIHRERSLV